MKLSRFASPTFLLGKQHMHSRLHVRRPTFTSPYSSILTTHSFRLKVSNPKSLFKSFAFLPIPVCRVRTRNLIAYTLCRVTDVKLVLLNRDIH